MLDLSEKRSGAQMSQVRDMQVYLNLLQKSSEYCEILEASPADQGILLTNQQLQFRKCLFNLTENDLTVMLHPNVIPVPLHVHDFYEIEYVSKGSLVQWINEERHLLKEGDICFFNRSTLHLIERAGHDTEMYHIMINPTFLSLDLLKKLNHNNLIGNYYYASNSQPGKDWGYILLEDAGQDIRSIVKSMYEECKLRLPYYHYLISSYFSLLCIKADWVIRQRQISGPSKIEKIDRSKQIAIDAINYICENIATATLGSTSTFLHLSEKHLCCTLKKITGKTFTRLLHDNRIELASYMLAHSDEPIEAVAYAIGFENVNYFYMVFKKMTGMTPNECRKQSTHIYLSKS